MKKSIPFSAPDITQAEIEAVNEVIQSGWLAHGKFSKRLEELFCEFTGAKYATTVSNCTAGLHLSCLAAGFGPGDEVIVPAQTHTATAHAVEYTGAKAVFADVCTLTGNILIEEIEKKLTSATKGIIPVHMAGYPVDMDGILRICEKNNLTLIEDCAHALGTQYKSRHAGNFGISGSFSFYPTKQITTGEGGVVISNNELVIDFINKHKAFGINTTPEMRKRPGVYDVHGLGYNFRMTDFQAALGVGQLDRYNNNLANRQANGKLYCELLSNNKYVEFPRYTDDNSYFLFQILIKPPIVRDSILDKLIESGIGVSIHYATPVPLMSYYRKKYGYVQSDFPNAVSYGNQVISLPVHSNISDNDIRYVVQTLKAFLDEE
ncbi:MAG: DegT/DnrJ/EryC1/StrS family aminotransferase [Bacteroidetes bacterium]|nr:DegT/DnrJ/EryC1/StrS family aminotransferase [Bacteroidota bacterium]